MKEIIDTHERLERDLRIALSTMERKSTIYDIKTQLLELQQQCPHFSDEYNFAMIDERCPYCGAPLVIKTNTRNF